MLTSTSISTTTPTAAAAATTTATTATATAALPKVFYRHIVVGFASRFCIVVPYLTLRVGWLDDAGSDCANKERGE